MKKIKILQYKQKDKDIYIFTADPNYIRKLVKISDISKNDKNFQRPFDERRIKEIKKYVLGEDKLYKKGRNIYAKGYIPNSIVLNLSDKYKVTMKNGNSYINFPEDLEIKNYKHSIEVIDGQHRLLAFDDECKSELTKHRTDYQMCFVAFMGLTEDEKKEVFMVLNERQKTVDKNILLRQKKLLNLLLDEEEIRYEIITKLNEDKKSPFKGMIVMAGEKIKYGLKTTQIDEIFTRSKIINKLADSKGQVNDNKYQLLLNYFNAWKESYGKIWFKNNNTLTKISGFRFICFLFSSIYDILTIDGKNDFRLEIIKKIIFEVKDNYFNDEFDIKKTNYFQNFQEKSGTIKLAENIGKQIYEQYQDKHEDFLV
ncbi:MAG: DGQHR domain-containing protein [Patescibacteria group bacterium]